MITDLHGVEAKAGMRAAHWGEDDQADRVFLGTIGEWIVRVGDRVIDQQLVFVYDEPPANQEERLYVPLEVITRFELKG